MKRIVAVFFLMCSTTWLGLQSVEGKGFDPKGPITVTLHPVEDALGVKFLIKVDTPTPLWVRVKNKDRDIVFQQSYSGSKSYKGVLNLENLTAGVYYFEIRHHEQLYQKEITLKEKRQRFVELK